MSESFAVSPIDIVQSIGIIGGFLISWSQIRQSNRLAKFNVFWQIGESHHDVWNPLVENELLSRILKPIPDLIGNPITDKERAFLTNLFIHIGGTFEAHKRGYYQISPNELKDINEFLRLPIPRQVWMELKEYQEPHFVAFIDQLLTGDARRSPFGSLISKLFRRTNSKEKRNEARTQNQ